MFFSGQKSETVVHGCSVKKVFLKILQSSQGNTYARVKITCVKAVDLQLY